MPTLICIYSKHAVRSAILCFMYFCSLTMCCRYSEPVLSMFFLWFSISMASKMSHSILRDFF